MDNVNKAQVLDNDGIVYLEDFYQFCIRKRIDYLSETIRYTLPMKSFLSEAIGLAHFLCLL